ncbi:MAG: TlpA family protein disulfide reductase [Deltaproteobacteria bacterium]|nr:TlpA family protein disulfide reductase [Deltaproteobacteria bacterium]
MRKLIPLICFAAVGLIAGCLPQGGGRARSSAPDLALQSIDGRTIYLGDYIGRKKAVVVTFWATWCKPCQGELKVLQELYEQERRNGLEVIAISIDSSETISRVRPLVRQLDLTFPVAYDADSQAVSLYNPRRAAPLLHIFDESGQIVYTHSTFRRAQAHHLRRKIRRVLDAAVARRHREMSDLETAWGS